MQKTLREAMEQAERDYLKTVLSEAHGRVRIAMELAGFEGGSLSHFYRKLQKYALHQARKEKK